MEMKIDEGTVSSELRFVETVDGYTAAWHGSATPVAALKAGKMKIPRIDRDARTCTEVADLRARNYVNVNWQLRRSRRWNTGERVFVRVGGHWLIPPTRTSNAATIRGINR